jgi:predicted RNA-binding Zn-ribbon protein involved in translation (DUF1610 family)
MGYMNSTTAEIEKSSEHDQFLCPVCGANIYISKYGNDFTCMDKSCVLNQSNGGFRAKELARKIIEILDICG